MTRFVKPYLLFAVLSITCLAQNAQVSVKRPVHGIPTRQKAAQPGTTNNGIPYLGGPVLNQPTGVNVYYIWYGNWSGDSSKQMLTDFTQRLGGSPYFYINTTYYDLDKGGQQDPVFNKVNLVASVNDNYSMGQSLADLDVDQLVANHTGVDLPIDENGVYFVLTSADVSEQEFCVNDCAWHNAATVSYPGLPETKDIKVAFVGNPNQCPAGCLVQDPSPNNNPAADSMASFVAHELKNRSRIRTLTRGTTATSTRTETCASGRLVAIGPCPTAPFTT